MTLDTFYANYNGRVWDYDRAYGAQCVDLVKYYLDNCYGIKPGGWGNAKDYFSSTHPAILARFNRIPNDPNNSSQLPRRGDIIIWNGNLPGSGGAGHIAIFDGVVQKGIFRSFDANWGGTHAHFVNHNWNYVAGWLTPKSSPAPATPAPNQTQGDEMIASKDEAVRIYEMLRPNGKTTDAEINGTAGKRTYKEFLYSGKKEVDARNAALRDQGAQLTNMQTTINKQNQTITNLNLKLKDATISNTEKQRALTEALETINKCTTELETNRDQISDLQTIALEARDVTATLPDEQKYSWIAKLVAVFLKSKKA